MSPIQQLPGGEIVFARDPRVDSTAQELMAGVQVDKVPETVPNKDDSRWEPNLWIYPTSLGAIAVDRLRTPAKDPKKKPVAPHYISIELASNLGLDIL